MENDFPESKKYSFGDALAKLEIRLVDQVHKLASNESLRLTLQKLRVLGAANWAFGIFSRLVARFAKDRVPVYFLGEKLLSEREWLSRLTIEGKKYEMKHPGSFNSELNTPYVTVLVSLYKSDDYLKSFLENIKTQTIIDKCEVVIVCVSPSEFERSALNLFALENNYVTLMFSEIRIGIYEAWNRAITVSTARFITNMNADDIRHPLSLEIQVSELEKDDDIDVVYQDVFYTLRQNLEFDSIARVGMKSNLPQASTEILARGINAPHNAPMWRRSLHDRIGLFDETFMSAGDHDFWIRASIAGANFKKSEEVHVCYFINPKGMSTKKKSPGTAEGMKILDTYRRYAQGLIE
jgi:GT2 family glycosyltransferase